MDLKQFDRFVGKWGTLTKKGSKRASRVGVGKSQTGDIAIHTFAATAELPEAHGIYVNGFGFNNYLRTSPVVKVVDENENSITFETEGGVYSLELKDEPA